MSDLSVIMPLYDAGPWVGAAIESVLERADGLLELIVVDDGSTDDGPEIARAYGAPVRVLAQAGNTGPAAARNAGLAAARGEVLGFLDADDLWLAGAPDPRRAHLGAAGIVAGRMQPVDVAGRPFDAPAHTMGLSTMLMRRAVWERHGGLDPALVYSEDVDWVLRLREAGVRLVTTPEVVFGARLRPGSLTRDRAATNAGLTSALAASLRRRGALGRGAA